MKQNEISDEQLIELIRIIGKPTLEYMLKRIQNKIVQDKNNAKLPVNSFLSVIIGSLAIINSTTLKWISESTRARTGEPIGIDIDKLRLALIKNINDQFGLQ